MSVIQINPRDAFEFLSQDKNSILVDVRTFEEINFVGTVDIEKIDKRFLFLPWKIFPEMALNKDFEANIFNAFKDKESEAKESIKLIFMCRSGARSEDAAKFCLSLGFKNCYNIIGGFEGELNAEGKRSKINGWKFDNMPWKQK